MKLEIITPDGLIFESEVDSVTAPGSNGQFQVLKGHASLLSKLDIGIMKVESQNGTDFFTCNGGVFEIDHDQVNVLTESSENYKSIDTARAEQAKDRAAKRLDERGVQVDITRAEVALARAVNRLKISKLK